MTFDSPSGRTHSTDCWRDPEHHACAVAMIERMRIELRGSHEDLIAEFGNPREKCDCEFCVDPPDTVPAVPEPS